MYREQFYATCRIASIAAVALLAGAPSGCVIASGTESEPDIGEVASPVIGGMAATKEQIFSTVALRRLGHDDDYICSGTLIAPSVVVTAAHCLADQAPVTGAISGPYDAMELTVIVGALDIATATEAQRFAVTKIVLHPQFPGSIMVGADGLGKYNDVAILLLQQPVTTLLPATVLPFGKLDSSLSQGKLVTIAGYGFNDAERSPEDSYTSPRRLTSDTMTQSLSPAPRALPIHAKEIRVVLSTSPWMERCTTLA